MSGGGILAWHRQQHSPASPAASGCFAFCFALKVRLRSAPCSRFLAVADWAFIFAPRVLGGAGGSSTGDGPWMLDAGASSSSLLLLLLLLAAAGSSARGFCMPLRISAYDFPPY